MSIERLTVIVAKDDAPDDDFSRALLDARVGVAPLRLMRIVRKDVDVDALIKAHGPFDIVAFTSKNAVDAIGADTAEAKVVAAVGKSTAQRLRDHGRAVDVVPDAADGGQSGAALATALAHHMKDLKGKKVFLPRAARGNDELKTALTAAGAIVVDVAAYDSVAVDVDADAVADVPAPRALFLTSPLRVAEFKKRVTLPDDVALVCIGETTAAAAREAGLTVAGVLAEPTPEALLDALHALSEP
jgi:uroporphyrinogen-III synthase